jgi:acetyl-CoA C-acetyltransferase
MTSARQPNDVVIVSACRTAVGDFQCAFATLRAPELGAIAIREAVRRAEIKLADIDEVILGCVIPAGLGQNPARQAVIASGMPDSISAFTINKVCGSGLKAVALAAQAIKAGDKEAVVAGGMECMSQTPYILRKARTGLRLGDDTIVDTMVYDGLWDYYNDFHMGMTAELVAERFHVSREEQDSFAANSHSKAVAAQKEGRFKDEIVPVEIKGKKGEVTIVDKDEHPREPDLGKLAKLKPAFKPTGGTVTAGNASSINDGASALVVMSRKRADALGVRPIARITAYGTGAVEPKWVMIAPLRAVGDLIKRMNVGIDHFDLVELNEAFSAAALTLQRELKVRPERLNVNGGAVALGHPIGASGARILTTLIYALKNRKLKTGLAALCLGGGDAVALAVEMEN